MFRRTNGSDRRTEASDSDSEASGSGEGGAIELAPASTSDATPAVAPSPRLEITRQEEPIRAWRGLTLVAFHHTVALQALNSQFGGFSADEHRAECKAGERWDAMYGPLSLSYIYSGLMYGNKRTETPPKPGVHDAPHETCDCGFYAVKDRSACMGGLHAEVDLYGKVIEHELGYRAEYQRVLSLRIPRGDVCVGGFLCDETPEMVAWKQGVMLTVCRTHASNYKRVATLGRLAQRLHCEVRWDD